MTKSNPVKQALNPTPQYVLDCLEVLDTPRSLACWLTLKSGSSDYALALDVNPLDYQEPYMYFSDAQASALIRKNPLIGSPIDTRLVAKEKYFRAEAECRKTNEYLRTRSYVGSTNLAGYLYLAQNFIRRLLKGVPKFSEPDFGPGASSACRGFEATIVHKLSTLPECTLPARGIVCRSVQHLMPGYGVSCGLMADYLSEPSIDKIPLVPGNTFTTVPKDSRGDRGICVEPHGNILVQKAIGTELRLRLKRAGWDLNRLPELHRGYAQLGSIDGSNATIDLSSASDTISTELVKELLPYDWFDLLNRSRSQATNVDGEWLKCEKFSSMGNGFTFELETIIFLSLAVACKAMHGERDDIVSVFGDDIIVPASYASELISVLKECGFSTNPEKTFITGPFRESCGNDFFGGVEVRPVFLKELPRNETEAAYTIANRIREIAYRFGHNGFCDGRFKFIWDNIVGTIPYHLRCFGPASFSRSRSTYRDMWVPFGQLEFSSLGDQVIASNYEKKFRCRKGWSFRVSYLARITRNRVLPRPEAGLELACALYGVSSKGVSPRGCRYTVVRRHTISSNWDTKEIAWL